MMICGKYIQLALSLAVLAFALDSCGNATEKNRISTDLINISATASSPENVGGSHMDMEHISFNFGTIAAGKIVNHVFRFINSGESPLLLSNVNGSCGCTVAKSWPKEPIMPGEGGEIIVVFDSSKRTGHQDKTIHVVSNSRPATLELSLVGNVIGPDFVLGDIISN